MSLLVVFQCVGGGPTDVGVLVAILVGAVVAVTGSLIGIEDVEDPVSCAVSLVLVLAEVTWKVVIGAVEEEGKGKALAVEAVRKEREEEEEVGVEVETVDACALEVLEAELRLRVGDL